MFFKFLHTIFFIIFIFKYSFNQDFYTNNQIASAHAGYYFYNLTTEKELSTYQHNKSFVPASILKLFSTAYALDVLKDDFKFSTKVFLNGKVKNDSLIGNLIIIPSFDPSINFDNFSEQILKALKERDIKVIQGKVLFKDTDLINSELPQTWMYEDVANYYGSQTHPFNFDENAYKIYFRQAKEGMPCSIQSIIPKVDLFFENHVLAGELGSGDNAYILGSPFSKERIVKGTIPPGNGLYAIKGSVGNPKDLFIGLISEYFSKNGIAILNEKEKIYLNEELLIDFLSPPLYELLAITNKKSNNLYAESLLMAAGNEQVAKDYNEALLNLNSWINNHKISCQNIQIYDACGLSRLNNLSPKCVVELLIKMKINSFFINSLSVSGQSGTLKHFTSPLLRDNLFAKSGSSKGILNYAGYFKNRRGEDIVFAIMINHHNAKPHNLKREIILFLEKIYEI